MLTFTGAARISIRRWVLTSSSGASKWSTADKRNGNCWEGAGLLETDSNDGWQRWSMKRPRIRRRSANSSSHCVSWWDFNSKRGYSLKNYFFYSPQNAKHDPLDPPNQQHPQAIASMYKILAETNRWTTVKIKKSYWYKNWTVLNLKNTLEISKPQNDAMWPSLSKWMVWLTFRNIIKYFIWFFPLASPFCTAEQ